MNELWGGEFNRHKQDDKTSGNQPIDLITLLCKAYEYSYHFFLSCHKFRIKIMEKRHELM